MIFELRELTFNKYIINNKETKIFVPFSSFTCFSCASEKKKKRKKEKRSKGLKINKISNYEYNNKKAIIRANSPVASDKANPRIA